MARRNSNSNSRIRRKLIRKLKEDYEKEKSSVEKIIQSP
jgi:hypothetical protein